MIAEDEGNFHFQFPGMIPAEQVIKAMVITGYKNGHPGFLSAGVHIPLHGVGRCYKVFKIIPETREGEALIVKITFQPHKKYPCLHIHMLIKIDYISTSGMYETGYVTDDPGLVRTVY